MQEAIKKIGELAGFLQGRIAFYEKLIKDVDIRTVKLNEQDKALVEKANNLLAREAKINPAEDVNALKEKAMLLKKEVDDAEALLMKAKNAFNKEMADKLKKLAEDSKKVAMDNQKNIAQENLLKQEWDALNKKKETLRADLINEIMKSQVR